MKTQNFTDQQLISMIRQSGNARKAALEFAFLTWRKLAKGIFMKAGAQEADVEDATSGAFIDLDNHIRNGNYEEKGSLKNYFLGIVKWKLYSNKRSTKRINWTADNQMLDGIEMQQPETLMLETEEKTLLQKMVNQLEGKCREVMKLYKLGYSREEIAEAVDLKNANNVRQWVFRCRKRLVELTKKNPVFMEYFKNQA